MTLTGRGDARRLTASRVSANLIDIWGLRMLTGRGFSRRPTSRARPARRDSATATGTASSTATPTIVGQTLMLDGRPATVVGVLDPAIEIGNLSEIDVWVAAGARRRGVARRTHAARQRPAEAGRDPRAGRAPRAAQFSQALAREHPKTNEGWTARVLPTRQAMTGNDTWVIMTLLSLVVGFVLLLACANLANLVLSRATGRRRELAVRSALGASRRRVIRQMLTENVIYGICGGLLGLIVANAGLAAMRAAAYEPFFRMVRIDRNVLLFTALLALVTPLLFAIVPAIQSTRGDASDALKDGGRTGGSVRAQRSRSVLIVAQLGLAVMLLVLATLLVQALREHHRHADRRRPIAPADRAARSAGVAIVHLRGVSAATFRSRFASHFSVRSRRDRLAIFGARAAGPANASPRVPVTSPRAPLELLCGEAVLQHPRHLFLEGGLQLRGVLRARRWRRREVPDLSSELTCS